MKVMLDRRGFLLALAAALLLTLPLGVAAAAGGGHGSLDPSFGRGGKVTTASGEFAHAYALAVQPDGKLVAAGKNSDGVALVRYNPDGSLDRSFGSGGKVTTTLWHVVANAVALVIQPDGKLVVAGSTYRINNVYEPVMDRFLLVRYNPDGSLDRSFGSGGVVRAPIGADSWFNALVIQKDGKLVAGGNSLARFNSDGSLDRRFGSGGIVTTAEGVTALVIRPDGKLVSLTVSGERDTFFTLARFKANGFLDRTFGSGGKVSTWIGDSGGFANALVAQRDGKLVAAGTSRGKDFLLVRYSMNGSLDRSFGSRGKVMTPLGAKEDEPASAEALVTQRDGKLVAAGYSSASSPYLFTLVRYNPNGWLDRSFGSEGKVTTGFGRNDGRALALVVQKDGKLVAAGDNSNGSPSVFALARYSR